MSNTVSIQNLRSRVLNARVKKASAASAQDPAEKGTVTAKEDPMQTPAKANMPENKENASNEGKKLEDQALQPSSTGKNMPVSPKDGNAEDKKGIEKSAKLKDRIKAALHKGEDTPAPAPTAPEPTATKTAGEADPVLDKLTPEALYKLAHAIFETEEGVDAILPVLRKSAGRDAAVELMKTAADEYYKAQQEAFYQAEMEKQAAAAEYAHREMIQEIVKSASSKEEAEQLIKAASAHYENTKDLNEFEKLAYAQGPEDAAQMLAAEEAGGEPALEGAGEPTTEQIIQLIGLAVQNGEISPEEAEALVAELTGGAEDPAAEAPPTAPEDGAVKEASASDSPADLLAKLRNRNK